MNRESKGNAEALRTQRQASQANTRQELELALARLRNGNPQLVKKGTPITPVAVAREAGVDRSTLYRFHEPVLSQIRKLTEQEPRQQLDRKRTELSDALAKARDYRTLLEQSQAELSAWARENYALTHRVTELDELVRLRDHTIAQLRSEVNQTVIALRK